MTNEFQNLIDRIGEKKSQNEEDPYLDEVEEKINSLLNKDEELIEFIDESSL